MGHMTVTTPISGVVCHPWTRTCNGRLTIKFEISVSAGYEDIKGDAKCIKWGLFVVVQD